MRHNLGRGSNRERGDKDDAESQSNKRIFNVVLETNSLWSVADASSVWIIKWHFFFSRTRIVKIAPSVANTDIDVTLFNHDGRNTLTKITIVNGDLIPQKVLKLNFEC